MSSDFEGAVTDKVLVSDFGRVPDLWDSFRERLIVCDSCRDDEVQMSFKRFYIVQIFVAVGGIGICWVCSCVGYTCCRCFDAISNIDIDGGF